MRFYINYDVNIACKVILQEQLELLNIKHKLLPLGGFEISNTISDERLNALKDNLRRYGINIVDNQKKHLFQQIKETIIEIVFDKDKFPNTNISYYLSEKFNLSYGHLASIFTEYTYTTIENFIIIQKIEKVKKLIIEEKLNMTEISYELNYSSVAHLSSQFKKVTGLTPSVFKRIIEKRKQLIDN